MTRNTGINFTWTGNGFGNALILAHMTHICNDNNIKAVFTQHRKTLNAVDVPLYDPTRHAHFYRHAWKGIANTHKRKNCDQPVIVQYVKHVESLTGMSITKISNHIPVSYYDMPDIPAYDVVMNTATGPWAPYRDWPYFGELKQMFNANKISCIDLNKHKIFGIRCLNHVKKAKVYLGLETGMSHYVSKFANGKALILQSGFCPFIYWTYPYDYDRLQANTDCEHQPCFINKLDIAGGFVCKEDNACMRDLSPKTVFNAVFNAVVQRL